MLPDTMKTVSSHQDDAERAPHHVGHVEHETPCRQYIVGPTQTIMCDMRVKGGKWAEINNVEEEETWVAQTIAVFYLVKMLVHIHNNRQID